MRIGYIINQYPKVTHTFVRTELIALEQAGVDVVRLAIRRADSPLIDAADLQETQRTRTVLDIGFVGVAAAVARAVLAEPLRFWRAARAALRLGWKSHRGVAIHLAYLAEACVLRGWTRELEIDHVHAHFGSNPTTVALLCRLLGGPPFSFTTHGPDDFELTGTLGIPEKIRHAAFVVVVSEAGRIHLQHWCDPPVWDRIHLVRCGIDARFRNRPSTPVPSARRIVFVGRLCAAKAPLLLVEAVGRLHRRGEPCDLVVLGDGPLRGALESRVAALGLADRVQILGWATGDEVQRQILAARALVLPSFAEGLPVALMEALALHRPVVCTPVGGVTELVEDGVCGWVIPPGSVDSLTEALRRVLDASPEELVRMGNAGAAKVAQQHDVALAARTLASLFEASVAAEAQAARGYGSTHPALSR